jgi:hypothetical protein
LYKGDNRNNKLALPDEIRFMEEGKPILTFGTTFEACGELKDKQGALKLTLTYSHADGTMITKVCPIEGTLMDSFPRLGYLGRDKPTVKVGITDDKKKVYVAWKGDRPTVSDWEGFRVEFLPEFETFKDADHVIVKTLENFDGNDKFGAN